MEDRGDSYDSKALAAAPFGAEMKRQATFRWRPAFCFVTAFPERQWLYFSASFLPAFN